MLTVTPYLIAISSNGDDNGHDDDNNNHKMPLTSTLQLTEQLNKLFFLGRPPRPVFYSLFLCATTLSSAHISPRGLRDLYSVTSFVPFISLPMTGQWSSTEMFKRVLCLVLNETTSSAKGHHKTSGRC